MKVSFIPSCQSYGEQNCYPAQQIDENRKFNVNVWHLQHRNVGEVN